MEGRHPHFDLNRRSNDNSRLTEERSDGKLSRSVSARLESRVFGAKAPL